MFYYFLDSYSLSGYMPIFNNGYGAIIYAYIRRKNGGRVIPSVSDLCFVHGSDEELLRGRVAVVRDRIICVGPNKYYNSIKSLQDDGYVMQRDLEGKTDEDWEVFGKVDIPEGKKPFVKVKEGRLIHIGWAQNGNSKVILRK